jgi:hypothetical protein
LESKVVPLASKVASKVIKESGEVVVETTLKDAIRAIYHTGIGCTGVTAITYTGLAVGKFVKKQVSPVVDAIAEAVVEKSLAVAIKGLEVAKDMPNDRINHGACHGTYFNQVVTNAYLATPKIDSLPQPCSELAVHHFNEHLNQVRFETFKAEYAAKMQHNQKFFSQIGMQPKPESTVDVIHNMVVDDIVREVASEQLSDMLLLQGAIQTIQELIALV